MDNYNRWEQRFSNYTRAWNRLRDAIKNEDLIEHINRIGIEFYTR